MKIRNTFIIFIVSGFWHGANWTFIVWGALNAIYFLPLLLTKNNRRNLDVIAQNRRLPTLREFLMMMLTFGLTVFAWIFFRAESLGHAISYIGEIFSASLFEIPKFAGMRRALITVFFVGVFILIEWNGRKSQYAIAELGLKWKRPYRYAMYYGFIICIFWFAGSEQAFIYFQF